MVNNALKKNKTIRAKYTFDFEMSIFAFAGLCDFECKSSFATISFNSSLKHAPYS